jgi:hypothetical protein
MAAGRLLLRLMTPNKGFLLFNFGIGRVPVERNPWFGPKKFGVRIVLSPPQRVHGTEPFKGLDVTI